MSTKRSLGMVLVALQAAALAYCFRTTVFSAVILVTALVGWLSRLRLASPRAASRWPIGLAVLYLIQRAAVPRSWYAGVSSVFFPDACLVAEYFLVFQVAQFFVRCDGDRLPSYQPILAIVTLTFCGDSQAHGHAHWVYQLFSMSLVALCALYFAACRQRGDEESHEPAGLRRVLLAIVLLTSGLTGWVAASGLYHYWSDLENALIGVLNPQFTPDSLGFSGQGVLGSVAARKTGVAAAHIALRVWAQTTPGYLRGRAFDSYQGGRWRRESSRIAWMPTPEGDTSPHLPLGQTGMSTFSLFPCDGGKRNRLEIWPNQSFEEVLFVPSDLAALQVPADRLSIDVHGIVECEPDSAPTTYVAWRSGSPAGRPFTMSDLAQAVQKNDRLDSAQLRLNPDAFWQRLTALPEDLDPRIRQLAERVAGEAHTTTERIAAVERYFHDHYRYQLGITIPPGTDPLVYFLIEKPPAHCEYFASGAAVLLRILGVPCRYVTGFVVAEQNDYGDYWVARNRDAHAWVEAYDPVRGWVLVEATPADGVPQPASASKPGQVWDALRAGWQRLLAQIRQGGLRAVLLAAARWLGNTTVLLVILLIASGLGLRWYWRRRGERSARPHDPLAEALRRLLSRMDRCCRKAGLVRQPHETLHQFADRVASAAPNAEHLHAAEWYRQYAALRYGGHLNPDGVELLKNALTTEIHSS